MRTHTAAVPYSRLTQTMKRTGRADYYCTVWSIWHTDYLLTTKNKLILLQWPISYSSIGGMNSGTASLPRDEQREQVTNTLSEQTGGDRFRY